MQPLPKANRHSIRLQSPGNTAPKFRIPRPWARRRVPRMAGTVSAEVFEDAAVGAADAAMAAAMAATRDEAKGETMDAGAARSRALRGRRSRVFPPQLLR